MTKPLYAVFFALLLLCGLSACSKPETALPVQTTVLILGDSLTQGVGASSAQTSYPALLKQQSQWNIINGGVSGNTSAQALVRLPELLQQHQPKLVIISIGGNDFLRQLPEADTRANIIAICRQALGSGAQVLLVAGGGITFATEETFRPHLENGALVSLLEDYLPPFPGVLDQQGIDLFLRYRMMTWGFTDINNQTACRSLSQKLRVNQAIVNNHFRMADTVQTFYRN